MLRRFKMGPAANPCMVTGTNIMLAAVCTALASFFAMLASGGAVAAQGDIHTLQDSTNSPVCGDRLCSEIAASPRHQEPLTRVDGCAGHEGKTRTYYIAADEVVWDYAPTGMNRITGHSFGDDESVFVVSDGVIGSKYTKAVYREYADATFAKLADRPAEWDHLGVLGPVIHAEVCDTIVVVFRNHAEEISYSMHPHGVFYEKDSEGGGYADGSSTEGDAVAPGETYTYVWPVPPRSGPGPSDPSSIVWMYHSHVDTVADTSSGLAGPIIITARGMADADGRPAGVDRELVSLFTVHDENSSHYLCDNVEEFMGGACTDELLGDPDFEEGNLMHGINGYVYGNQPIPELEKGEKVRWYLIGMGTEVDLHTPHWHGNTALWNGMRVDVMELMPASLKTVDFEPDNPGTWLFHCHVNDHISAGMLSLFSVA